MMPWLDAALQWQVDRALARDARAYLDAVVRDAQLQLGLAPDGSAIISVETVQFNERVRRKFRMGREPDGRVWIQLRYGGGKGMTR